MNDLHPLAKLLVSLVYVFTVASVGKYEITPLILLSGYLFFVFITGELSLKEGLYRVRLILPLVIFVGIFNPFFDKTPVAVGSFIISGGVISMLTLMVKGLYTVLGAYVLIATTSIDDICYALRCLHIPKVIVIVVMLIYRYFDVMAAEADRIFTAYRLRAPRQKGIHYKAWGTLVGQWLLRSMDRAELVYESMLLRGFDGDFHLRKKKTSIADILYFCIWITAFVAIIGVF